ncbi:hypothetical protein TNCV_4301521 [Trichonephila clavipes]|uniref:Uncharacterized protein n=1 Tax=Trichonephila clavipes TaxID=2585209 RepID=A0A8X6RTV6_TRICX|nr:hypothetical protein TNCV_4301521 [Trichonephila clavipes]
MNKIRKHQKLVEIFEKVSVLLDCPTVSSKEFVALNYDNECRASIMVGLWHHFGVCSKQKNIYADSCDKIERNNAAPVPMSYEMRNTMKSVIKMV